MNGLATIGFEEIGTIFSQQDISLPCPDYVCDFDWLDGNVRSHYSEGGGY